MEKSEMLFIANKCHNKGYFQEQMRDGDDCYLLSGEDGNRIKDIIAGYMKEIDRIGRVAFYEKYKEFKLY
jgi:hypothetical protein